jgi:hypothetical protein
MRVAFDPVDPERVLAGTSLGLLLTSDGGESWRWICLAAYGAQSWEDPSFTISAQGAIVVGHSAGYARSDQGCSWEAPPAVLQGRTVGDVVATPDGKRLLSFTDS